VLLHPPATARIASLVAFGAGSQIKSHVSQLLVTYPSITHVTIINRTLNDRVAALLGALRAAHPAARFAAISSAADDYNDPAGGVGGGRAVEAAVRQADCVCCATPSTAPLFRSEWVRPGAHVILAGSYAPEMAEADAALVRRARRVLVDSRSACALEAGELIAAGLAPGDMVEVGELFLRERAPVHDGKEKWEWAAEVDAARVAEVLGAGDVTIFKSVGVGAQDVAISAAVVDRAIEMGIGTRIPQFDDAV
jgi:ornithine cyclodeaminase/alanine dehydrogenase-like protein (mu-crystallin family)